MADQLVFTEKGRVGAWVAEKVDQTASWGDFYAMGLERDGELIAGIVFNNFNGSNAAVHIAIDRVTRGVIELLNHAATYAFDHCRLNRLTGLVEASNKKALSLNRHIGFENEFTMKAGAPDGGDLEVLVLWPETWRDKSRWLKGK